mgnify:FL=1
MASKQQHPITSRHDDPHDDVTTTWLPISEPVRSIVATTRTRYELTRDAREFCEGVDKEFVMGYMRFGS